MAAALRILSWAMGVACTLIGLVHLGWGIRSVPGEHDAGATVDSRERFYNAVFAGYGWAWMWVARQRPIPARGVQALTAVFALGATGRLVSMLDRGRPHRFQTALTGVELVLPPVFLVLARADEERARAAGAASPKMRAPGTATSAPSAT